MFTKLKMMIASVGVTLMFAVAPLALPIAVHAADDTDISGTLTCGTQLTDATGCTPTEDGTNGSGKIISIAKTVINILSLIVGIIAVIMIVFGGLRYITSGGDSGKVGSAKNTIVYAIIGLIIVALAQAIVQFVLVKTLNDGA